MAVRWATEADLHEIAALIRELAAYERAPEAVVFDLEELRRHLFGPDPKARVLIAEDDGRVVGFALFFRTFSTWLGKPGLFLEDLFVRPEFRHRGHGRSLLAALARVAVAEGCARLEWRVLDWNEPAIRFYESLGAWPLREWISYRVEGEALDRLAAASPAP